MKNKQYKAKIVINKKSIQDQDCKQIIFLSCEPNFEFLSSKLILSSADIFQEIIKVTERLITLITSNKLHQKSIEVARNTKATHQFFSTKVWLASRVIPNWSSI